MRRTSTRFFPLASHRIARVETVRQQVGYDPALFSPEDFHGFGGDKLLSGYVPHMVSIKEANAIATRALENTTKSAQKAQQSTLGRFWLARCDAKELPALLPYAVILVASQSNGNESKTRVITAPSKYRKDPTQGPRSQLADIIAAIARYQQITQCDFLKAWRQYPEFETVFFEENGYLTPHVGKEKEAALFLSQHIHELLINVERINPALQHTCIQVLSFGLALGAYDFPMDDFLRNQTRAYDVETQTQLSLCSRTLLEAEYRFTAQVAITEALANPDKRIPLVLTMVGGGVFGNSPLAIASAIRAAEEEIMRSGVTNIDLCISAWTSVEINRYIRFLGQQKSLFGDKSTPIIFESALKKTSELAKAATLEQITEPSPSFFSSKLTEMSDVIDAFSKKARFYR